MTTEQPARFGDPKPLLSATEAARWLGMPRASFYRFITAAEQEVPTIVVRLLGCRLLVRRSVLEDFIAGQIERPALSTTPAGAVQDARPTLIAASGRASRWKRRTAPWRRRGGGA